MTRMTRFAKIAAAFLALLAAVFVLLLAVGVIRVGQTALPEEAPAAIQIVHGDTGEVLLLQEQAEMDELLSLLGQMPLWFGVSDQSNGYRYAVTLKDASGQTVASLELLNASQVRQSHFIYTVDAQELMTYLSAQNWTP